MDFLAQLRARLQALLDQRAASQTEMDGILAAAAAENRSDLTAEETARFAEIRDALANADATISETTARIDQLVAARAAADAAAALAAQYPAAAGGAQVRSEPATYTPHGDHSFFHDLTHRSLDPGAAERISRNQNEMRGVERRAGTTANLAGLIPPQYLIDLFAPILRSGRITAGLVRRLPLPAYGTSFNFGRGTTGTTVGIQATENATLATADYDDTLTSFSLSTLGGYTEMSRQEIDRSAGGDQVIMADLASIYSFVLNQQVINGSGASGQLKGILNATGILGVTYTDATPTVPEIYSKIADAIQQVNTSRLMAANAIVMHPRRWGWFTAALDSQSRPLVSVNGAQFNSVGVGDAATGVGPSPVGTLLGLPVYVDSAIPTNLGAGTNEDRIIVARFDDDLLMEDDGVVPYRVYEEPGSAALTLRIVVAGYAAFTAERYAAANAVISGTGLVSPTF